MKSFTINQNDAGQRISKFVEKTVPALPNNLLYKYFRLKRIKLNKKRCQPQDKLQAGDLVELYINDEFFGEGRQNLAFLKVPSSLNIIYEDEKFTVILDASPATKGHALILPKNHAANIYELPDEDAADIFVLAKKLATKMTEILHCDGFNIVQNNGEVAGQTVFHFHMHLIPRYKNDGNEEKLCWNHADLSAEEIAEICKTLDMRH